jgi:hypothetical protein
VTVVALVGVLLARDDRGAGRPTTSAAPVTTSPVTATPSTASPSTTALVAPPEPAPALPAPAAPVASPDTSTDPTVAATPPRITVSPSTADPGDQVTISGYVPMTGPHSCDGGDSPRLTSTSGLFPPDGFGPAVPQDASGNFQMTLTILTETPSGSYRIGLRCGGGNVGVSSTLQVI